MWNSKLEFWLWYGGGMRWRGRERSRGSLWEKPVAELYVVHNRHKLLETTWPLWTLVPYLWTRGMDEIISKTTLDIWITLEFISCDITRGSKLWKKSKFWNKQLNYPSCDRGCVVCLYQISVSLLVQWDNPSRLVVRIKWRMLDTVPGR